MIVQGHSRRGDLSIVPILGIEDQQEMIVNCTQKITGRREHDGPTVHDV